MTNEEINYLQSIVDKILRFLSIAEIENEEKSKAFKVIRLPVENGETKNGKV